MTSTRVIYVCQCGEIVNYEMVERCESCDTDTEPFVPQSDADSLRLELAGSEHVRRKDNEYLLGEIERLRGLLERPTVIDLEAERRRKGA